MPVSFKLTLHHKRILAALRALPSPVHRCEIGRLFPNRWGSIQLRTMLALREAGLVEPEHELAVKFMQDGICRCGCDRWLLTPDGAKAADSLNINWDRNTLRTIDWKHWKAAGRNLSDAQPPHGFRRP